MIKKLWDYPLNAPLSKDPILLRLKKRGRKRTEGSEDVRSKLSPKEFGRVRVMWGVRLTLMPTRYFEEVHQPLQ